jgi:hypothetical protein
MLALRDREAIARVADPELRALIERRVEAILAEVADDDGYELHELVLFVVVQPGDPLEAIDEQLGFPVLSTRWEPEARFGTPAFRPSWELLWEHAGYYEVLFILSDDGYGIDVFVAKRPGVDPKLLAMCAAYATPAEEGDS